MGMASEWFYQVMGNQIGPVSSAELRNLAQQGAISRDTLVRKAPGSAWVLAERVQGLFSPSRPLPTSASSPTPKPKGETSAKEGGDFANWLRHNIRQTLIAWPIIATVIALLVALFELADQRGARGGALVGQVLGAWVICLLVVPLALLAFWLYFLPTIEAKRRNHPHYFGILTLNLGLGWTFLGWLGALVWARMVREGGNCWRCNARLNGFPLICQFCQAELVWDRGEAHAP
jgi:hypothetical protein